MPIEKNGERKTTDCACANVRSHGVEADNQERLSVSTFVPGVITLSAVAVNQNPEKIVDS